MLEFFRYPRTDFNKLNLDWIMKTIGQLKDAIPLVAGAQAKYEEATAAVNSATTAVSNATTKANQAAASASAAAGSADTASGYAASASEAATAAAASASEAATSAANAASDASTANANAQAAFTNASNALSAATAAANEAATANISARWTFLEQLEVYDGENHRDVQSSLIEVTTAKGGLLLEVVDGYSTYGSGTIEIPAPALRGVVPNYLSTTDDSRFFYWSPLGSATAKKLGIRVTVTTEIVGSGADAVTHYYARVRITGTSTTLSTDPCYINIYGR